MQKMRKSGWDRAFNAVNALIMVLVLVVTLYPFWYVLVGSVSSMGIWSRTALSSGRTACTGTPTSRYSATI